MTTRWPNRWGLLGLVCLDCGYEYRTEPRGPGILAALHVPYALIIVTCPEVCPHCRNLRLVQPDEA
jgi:hypothetical protein